MEKNKRKITFTNILFIIATIVYILNIFVISPDTGSMSKLMMEQFQGNEELLSEIKIICKLFGTWGGHLNDILGFNSDKVLSGEIWRIFTVVFTHAHIAHFVMNMLALIIAGSNIEKKYGSLKTIGLFIVLNTINGFITDFIYFNLLGNEIVTSYGASGWITVLMGMILTKSLLNKDYFKNEFKKGSRIYLIIYFVSTTFILMPNLFTITAHVSGLIEGAIAEFIIYKYFNKKSLDKEQIKENI